METKNIEQRITELMKEEDRKDPEFRCIIALTELGDLGKYITHDPKLNPGARLHGTKEDEALAYGQTLVQLIALVQLRKIDLEYAIEKGLKNWEDADWRKKEAKNEKIQGMTACYGEVTGKAYMVSKENNLESMEEGSIIVTMFAKPDIVQYLSKAMAVVTDEGGVTCHLANIARERNVPCIVGTGNATKKIKHDDIITVDAKEKEGNVYITKIKK